MVWRCQGVRGKRELRGQRLAGATSDRFPRAGLLHESRPACCRERRNIVKLPQQVPQVIRRGLFAHSGIASSSTARRNISSGAESGMILTSHPNRSCRSNHNPTRSNTERGEGIVISKSTSPGRGGFVTARAPCYSITSCASHSTIRGAVFCAVCRRVAPGLLSPRPPDPRQRAIGAGRGRLARGGRGRRRLTRRGGHASLPVAQPGAPQTLQP